MLLHVRENNKRSTSRVIPLLPVRHGFLGNCFLSRFETPIFSIGGPLGDPSSGMAAPRGGRAARDRPDRVWQIISPKF